MIALDPDTRTQTAEEFAVDAALAASGDATAFERLYRAHASRIHSLARRMVGPDEADEATQDVFVRAWDKLSTFRGDAAFSTWLHRVAVNVMLGRRQKAAKFKDRFAEEGEEGLDRFGEEGVSPGWRLDLEAAVERLPDGARQVFVLHDVEGYKHQEIGKMLGVTSGTTKAQLHRARMMLRKHLDR
ncbi:MAG: RNA polymerase sigma factor [Gemmatimonadota bacterium]|nr:RNA polymerase sigma factor [Gemmatimonadota bacterium]